MPNAHAFNYMSTITIVVFNYHYRDSITDDNDSRYYCPALMRMLLSKY